MRAPALNTAEPGRAVPVGHRGAPRIYPENTLEAFDRAVELGAGMIELDVRQAADGTLVVFHDEDVSRMTGGEGHIHALTWDRLAKLKIDGWWGIPRLDAVLRRMRERVWVNVEIKQADPARVAEAIASAGMRDQVIVSSFDWDILRALGNADARLPRALLTEDRLDAEAELARHGASGWFPRADLVTSELVTQVHQAGGFLMPWTVDDPGAMRQLVALGVDAICSNEVEAVVAATV